jgi:uncharacterized protein (DUF885 family)
MKQATKGHLMIYRSRSRTLILISSVILFLLLFLSACEEQGEELLPTGDSTNIENPIPQDQTPQVTSEIIKPTGVQEEIEPTQQSTLTPTEEPEPSPTTTSLTIDEFFEDSFRQLLTRDPELVTDIGLADVYGTGNDKLTDISDSYVRETQALEAAALEGLRSFDSSSLTPDQKLSYEIYEWYLQDLVDGHRWMYHDYPLTFFILSIQNELELFMTDLHHISDKKDAEDYISRLAQVGDKFSQALDGLKIREEMEVIPPRFVIDWTISDLQNMASRLPQLTPYYTSFAQRMSPLSSVNPEEQQELLDRAETVIANSVFPGYKAALAYMQELAAVAASDDGAWKLPSGRDYYAYTLRHHTTTDMSADEIHELGLQELERIHSEIRALASELGYMDGLTLRELYAQAEDDSGYLSGPDVVAQYESIIQRAESEMLPEAFGLVPNAGVIVIGGDKGAYYVQPSLDGSRPGAFYARTSSPVSRLSMPSLVYHEAVPGHHLQIAIARELEGVPSFRTGVDFNGYVEGWGLYAERLASELGFYDDDPYGDLGRLQLEAWRAARMVIDTGIHDKGWTYDEAVDFMIENTGEIKPVAEYEVARYIVVPGQATSYMVGMLKILELRGRAMDALGEAFDLKEFHDLVLGSGSVPLEILEQIVDTYIKEMGG